MAAAILSIGTELTRGELVNTNATWLSQQLTELGHRVVEHATVPDDLGAIATTLQRLAHLHDVVLATGGLGPTSDDMTSAAVALAKDVKLVRDEGVEAHIRALYASRGRELTDTSAKQADFPEQATVLPNPVGTAPGFSVTLLGAYCCFMPGVPREMKAIFSGGIREGMALTNRDHQLHFRVFGLPESEVAERIADLEQTHRALTLGYRASFPEIEVKVHVQGKSSSHAKALAHDIGAEVEERLRPFVYGGRDDSLPSATGDALKAKGQTLALAESCTGGMVGQMLTQVPGSSAFLLFGAITYANSAKENVLGVPAEVLAQHGAVSSQCAAAMAEGARRVGGSDIAVSITGIAGPGGGSEEKPVGTVWFGLCDGEQVFSHHHHLPGSRDQVRRRAAFIALEMVRRRSQGVDIKGISPFTIVAEDSTVTPLS